MAGGGDAYPLRNARELRGSIANAAATGMSLATLLDHVRNAYNAAGVRFNQTTIDAVSRMYSQQIESARKGLALTRVRSDAPLGPRWIGYGFLQRDAADFATSPRYRVQYRVTGERDGVSIDKWITNYYGHEVGPLPATIGGLREDLLATALEGPTEDLSDSTLSVGDIRINAI